MVGSRKPFVISPRVLESYHLEKHPAYLHPGVEETILDPTHVNAKPPSSPPEGPFVPATSVAPPGLCWEGNHYSRQKHPEALISAKLNSICKAGVASNIFELCLDIV